MIPAELPQYTHCMHEKGTMEYNSFSSDDYSYGVMSDQASLTIKKKTSVGQRIWAFLCENRTTITLSVVSITLLASILYLAKRNKEIKAENIKLLGKADELVERYANECAKRAELIESLEEFAIGLDYTFTLLPSSLMGKGLALRCILQKYR